MKDKRKGLVDAMSLVEIAEQDAAEVGVSQLELAGVFLVRAVTLYGNTLGREKAKHMLQYAADKIKPSD